MSQENVEIVRRVLNEFLVGLERGDPGAFFGLDVIPSDYEFVLAEPIDLKPVWIGREEFVEFMHTWFEDYSIQVERLIDAGGNRVGDHPPVRRPDPFALRRWPRCLSRFRVGARRRLLIRCTTYTNDAGALEAAGLSE